MLHIYIYIYIYIYDISNLRVNRWKSQALPLEGRNITQYIMCITDVPDVKILGIQYHSIRATNVRTTSPTTMNQRAGARNMSEGFVCPEYGTLCTCIPTPPDIVLRANFADHSNTKRRFSTTNSWFVGHGDIAFRLPSQLFVRPCAARSRPR